MKTAKRIFSIMLSIIMLVSVMSVSAEAAKVVVYEGNDEKYGYMVPVNYKGTEVLSTVKVYGQYDYINFYIKAQENEPIYYFYGIYSDKKLTKCVQNDVIEINGKGEYSYSLKLKLKGKYKSKTYYVVTYAAMYDEHNDIFIVDAESMCQFKLKVDRTTSFSKQKVMLKETKNTTKGAYIKWSKLSGTYKYNVYRRSITGSKWKKVGTVSKSKTSFTDTSVKNKNGNYIYTVKAVNKKGTVARYHYHGLTCLFAKTPTMKSISVTYNDTIEVKWNSTSSKAKYNIMRKEGSGSWKTIKTNYSGTSYKDTTAKSGKKYTYSVKAVLSTSYGKATSSYYANSDMAVTYLESPMLNSVAPVENGVNVSWGAVNGATGYTILRKNMDGSSGWASVGKVGADATNFVDTSAGIEETYTYSVRSEAAKNKGSYDRKGIDYIILDKPVIAVKENRYNEVEISWNEIPYATGYEVYCRSVGSEWEMLGAVDSTKLYFTYDLITFGDFEFSVRAVRNDKTFSEYAEAFAYHQEAMVICSSVAFTDGIELGWDDHGYDSYNIYRSLSTEAPGEEVLIGNVTGNTFKDTTVENDVEYKYKVIGVIDGEEYENRTYTTKIGIATTVAPPNVPQVRVIDDVLTQYWDDYTAYAYNFKYGYWASISFDKTKEYYEEYIQDGKMKLAYSDTIGSYLKTPIDSTIKEKVWFDNKIDYTVKVKNKDVTIICKSLGDNIDSICINHGSFDTEGKDTVTVTISLEDDEKYYDLEIQVYTDEYDCATVKERIYLE